MYWLVPRSDVRQIVGRIRREHTEKRTPFLLDLVDKDSWVLDGYFSNRMKWYAQVGAKVETKGL